MWWAIFLAAAMGIGIYAWDFYEKEIPEATQAITNDMPSDAGSTGKPVWQGTTFDQDGKGNLRLRLFSKTPVEFVKGQQVQPELRVLCYNGGVYAYLYLGVPPAAASDWLQFNGGESWLATQDGGYQAPSGAAVLTWLESNTLQAKEVSLLTSGGQWPPVLFEDNTIGSALARLAGCSN